MVSPVPASTTPLATVSAPIESDGISAEPAFPLNTGSVSVSGVNTTAAAAPAALVDFHTPPPVVPTYSVLPLASAGSTASAVTRPVKFPNTGLATCAGPTGAQGTVKNGVARLQRQLQVLTPRSLKRLSRAPRPSNQPAGSQPAGNMARRQKALHPCLAGLLPLGPRQRQLPLRLHA